MAAEPLVINTLTEASDLINLDILSLIKEGPAETLNLTENTQPILLGASVALWRLWQQKGGAMPEIMAEHSLGKYSALVCSEALSFADALHLVKNADYTCRKQYLKIPEPWQLFLGWMILKLLNNVFYEVHCRMRLMNKQLPAKGL